MTLRATRQNIEALVEGGTSNVRISRLHLQVLLRTITSHEASASNAITITGTAGPGFWPGVADNTITITGAAKPGLWTPLSSNSITITHHSKSGFRPGFANNVILPLVTAIWQGPIPAEATSSFTVTNSVVKYEIEQTTESTIAITQAATATVLELHQLASSQLYIQNFADHIVAERSPYNLLTITQLAEAEITSKLTLPTSIIVITNTAIAHLHTRLANNDITITSSTIGKNAAVHVTASNAIELLDEASFTGINRHETYSEITTYSYYVNPQTGEVSVIETGLENTAVAELTKINRLSDNNIEINQSVIFELDRAGYFERCVESIITISQTIEQDFTAESIITMTSAVDFEYFGQPRSVIEITQTLARELVGNRSADSTVGVAQTVTYDIIKVRDFCNYEPFIGSSTDSDAPTPPAVVPPSTTRANYIILRRGIDVLTLRLPELRNRHRLDFTRINRESRGGNLVIYADPIWPKTQNMQLDFIGLSESEGQEVLTFIANTLGKEIVIHDWESRSWYGFITNPDTPMSRSNKNSFSIALELDVIEDSAFLGDTSNTIDLTQLAAAEVV